MSWIKRNLYFVIGATVAVVLLGLAGWYLYSKWDQDSKSWETLNTGYEDLKKLNQQNPHPGSGQVDNIQAAREQQKELRAFAQKTYQYFQKIPPIPDLPKLADRDFSSALDRTINQLRRDATNGSVALPPEYSFSFEAQRRKVTFQPGSLPALSTQLGEVKVISDILVQAKINSLDGLRRERVSADDAAGNQTDYLSTPAITNEVGVLTPYELTFRCFSPELALVLAGFGSSPYGLLVKSVNVEPAAPLPTDTQITGTGTTPPPIYTPAPVYTPPPPNPNLNPEFVRGPEAGGRVPYRPPQPVTPVVATAAAPARGGLPTVLDERQLKVTMVVEVVKLASPAK